jgi:calcineurin-like phosphoesterase family protein
MRARICSAALAALLLTAVGAGGARAVEVTGKTTVQQTIVPTGSGAFRLLTGGAGERYITRQDGIGTAQSGRERRRESLLYFAQLTDFQLVDEESPARAEFVDRGVPAGWRPMEALGAQGIDSAIRQVNAFVARSPVAQEGGRRARMAFGLLTGDNVENMQRNETEWVVRLIEGGTVRPNSGNEATPVYTGVQDYDDQPLKDTYYYDPDSPEGDWAAWPRYPGLLDQAQAPFGAAGLGIPTYATFGNHDALLSGNQAATAQFEALAVGSLKLFGTTPGLVAPDPKRQFVSKKQYKELFKTPASSNGHGFGLVDPAEEAASRGAAGYYAWKPKPGIRFVALDTVCEGGVTGFSHNGNVDDAQFRWLERQLQDATAKDELVVLLSHHSITRLNCSIPDEVAPACSVDDAHGHDVNAGCDLDPRRSSPLHLDAELTALALRYPHVIAWIAGHTHDNVIDAFPARGGGFWSVRTASEIDWPPQSRLIELMDNRDGTLSLFGTMIDHAGRTEIPASGTTAGGFSASTLASISRVFAFNDPQNGAFDSNGPGLRKDRNVELLIRDPRRNPPLGRRRCASLRGRIKGKTVHRARLGRTRRAIRRRYPSRRTRGGFDYFCLADGKRVRVGYPTRQLRRRLARGLSRRLRGRAVLILTSSPRLRVKRVRPGVRTSTMRRRVRGERLVLRRRGVSWYVARGRRAQVVFRTRRGRVREVGLASRRLARTKRGSRRLIRSF